MSLLYRENLEMETLSLLFVPPFGGGMEIIMLNKMFIQILSMSLTASFVILFVLIARLLLKKTPKIFSYILWIVVLLSPVPVTDTKINISQTWMHLGEIIWITGIVIIILFSMFSLIRLNRKLVSAVKLRDDIYITDHIASPFVFGLLHQRIYLPSMLSEREQGYIILHEQTHIRRFDHIVKIVAFLTLALHWFNPLVWIAFILCSKDMEMSCDESVMRQMKVDIRQEYSASLLSLATGRKNFNGLLLAFGEGNTKDRIKNVMNYRKPTIWITITAVIAVAIMGICLFVNPKDNTKSLPLGTYVLDSSINSLSHILLEENNQFIFTYSTFSSYMLSGTYRIEDEYLILTTSDELYIYIFGIDEGALIFQAAQSSEMKVYRLERPLLDGDIFIYKGTNAYQ